jgi:hypothetical protein
MEICITDNAKKNLGKSRCNKLPKLMKGMITTPDDFVIEAAYYVSGATLLAALQALVRESINDRGYLWPAFHNIEDNSEESQYEDTPLARIPIRDGNYRFKPLISKNLCMHKAMYSHRAINEGRVFFIDVDNQLFGTEDDDGNIRGFKIGLLWTEKLRISNGSNSTLSPIVVDLADNEEIDAHGVLLDGSSLTTLEPLTDVTITSISQVVGTLVFEVKQTCDGTPVSGLVVGDILVYAADGNTLQAKLALTENANIPGRYTLTSPGGDPFENGTLTLLNAGDLSVGAYEAEEALTVNV